MKKSFREIYSDIGRQETPKMKFRRQIAEITGKKDQTVKQWLVGTQFPSDDDIEKIASYLGTDSRTLFPTKPLK